MGGLWPGEGDWLVAFTFRTIACIIFEDVCNK